MFRYFEKGKKFTQKIIRNISLALYVTKENNHKAKTLNVSSRNIRFQKKSIHHKCYIYHTSTKRKIYRM